MRFAVPEIRARAWFLRCLGVLSFAAFVSLAIQVRLLIGEDGLLPLKPYLAKLTHDDPNALGRWLRFPTLFWFVGSDAALLGACIAGACASVALTFLVVPRAAIAAAWVLYLSLTVACREFLSFQWDTLLLETLFFAFFYAPAGVDPFRGRDPPERPVFRWLMIWLLFRLNFESGVAKLAGGDPHWSWKLPTALVEYYETAPLPTVLGWWAHQLPRGGHVACGWFTLATELVVPFGLFLPRTPRRVALALMASMQMSILATANYGIFNWLSIALCLPAWNDAAPTAAPPRPLKTILEWCFSGLAAATSVLVFVVGVLVSKPWPSAAAIADAVAPFRSINSYHLFVRMTVRRLEVVYEWSQDKEHWHPYEFRWKPGDPKRAPSFVAPHQPRVDFKFWFLTLGDRSLYATSLVYKLAKSPDAVAPLFDPASLPPASPRWIRAGIWQYKMTDMERRAATGEWWDRTLVRYLPDVYDCSSDEPPPF